MRNGELATSVKEEDCNSSGILSAPALDKKFLDIRQDDNAACNDADNEATVYHTVDRN